MRFFDLFKCCKPAATENHFDDLPPSRVVLVNQTILEKSNSVVPIYAIPVPKFDVSISSSTSLTMFEDARTTRVRSRLSSSSDSSTLSNFCSVSMGTRRTSNSSINDGTKNKVAHVLAIKGFSLNDGVDHTLATEGFSLHADDEENDHTASSLSSTSTSPTQVERVNPATACVSPFGDEHKEEFEPLSETFVEYAPTTPSWNNEYTERAMEYQRCLCSLDPTASSTTTSSVTTPSPFSKVPSPSATILSTNVS
ncbi:hypothetical protein AUEXF2481DRAFT_42986 [Aureobasidium subglaciale EXF-2481]|uniref:Uncharacterized protein n=1 Tax=Aureobasidium subglaciale (strain EXF-2481) TaxID=1043005 RepID=A0A074Z0D6_AURSE|nr:uncharacterized protein AUEXF2481DRAFT_42986 [Aureobasidium subglaciale EXF-2481]KEQ92551.1 hypothetical protein AUEXF2481DRAFT_42986 [Aureobasidium subglaciale EXF-2481]